MLRKFLTIILPLITPIIVYAIYVALARRKARLAGEGRLPRWQEAPWSLIIASGITLMVIALIGHRFMTGVEPGAKVAPPRVVDGEIEPSRVVD